MIVATLRLMFVLSSKASLPPPYVMEGCGVVRPSSVVHCMLVCVDSDGGPVVNLVADAASGAAEQGAQRRLCDNLVVNTK